MVENINKIDLTKKKYLLRVSPSTLSMISKCYGSANLRSLINYESNDAALKGSICHSFIEYFAKNKLLDYLRDLNVNNLHDFKLYNEKRHAQQQPLDDYVYQIIEQVYNELYADMDIDNFYKKFEEKDICQTIEFLLYCYNFEFIPPSYYHQFNVNSFLDIEISHELKLGYSHFSNDFDDCTVDFVAKIKLPDNKWLVCISDYKSGFIEVEAADNLQLYAYAATYYHQFRYDFGNDEVFFCLNITQPNSFGRMHKSIIVDLNTVKLQEQHIHELIKKAQDKDAICTQGDHCTNCDALMYCDTFRHHLDDIIEYYINTAKMTELTDDQLLYLYAAQPLLKKMSLIITALVEERYKNGSFRDTLTLKPGSKVRRILDEQEFINKVTEVTKFTKEDLCNPPSLKKVAELDKLLGKKLVNSLATIVPNKDSLVFINK